MSKLGVLAGIISCLSFGVMGCNESTPTGVAQEELGRSEVVSSSSTDEESSSSGEKSSSSVKKMTTAGLESSSSSREAESSSSKTESSSSRKALSSSSFFIEYNEPENIPLETNEWYGGGSTYRTEKVVASNASELECNESTNPADLAGYEVAYEFNLPNDLGRDSFGKNRAYIDNRVTAISAECGSAVFDGSNGFLIPLSDVFKSRGFVAEVRFMPTAAGVMGNIFVAEPPGSKKNGWQIRIDGTVITFHMRDVNVRTSWESKKLGEVTLNEWHVVRVKIFPKKDEMTGKIFYTLNTTLDGIPRNTSEFNADMSQIEYGLGIGYDSMNQTLHNDRFFTGKIDYIRYGRISEEGL